MKNNKPRSHFMISAVKQVPPCVSHAEISGSISGVGWHFYSDKYERYKSHYNILIIHLACILSFLRYCMESYNYRLFYTYPRKFRGKQKKVVQLQYNKAKLFTDFVFLF